MGCGEQVFWGLTGTEGDSLGQWETEAGTKGIAWDNGRLRLGLKG